MKPFFLSALLLVFSMLYTNRTEAQKKSNNPQRCATMNRLELALIKNPALRTANEAKAKKILSGSNAGKFRLQSTITIPVVVHIVLPNPFLVSDADVQAQIDRLNLDFSGLNSDSTNASNFYNVRGHSQIRFCLARRTPSGQLTNGIERRASGTGFDAGEDIDPIKRSSLGGLNAWNTEQYLNLWVGKDASSQGILGYAANIGPIDNLDDGVVLNFQAFGSSSCYTMLRYNLGRTATHEIGHYLGLYHIWGSSAAATCSDDDFRQLPATTSCSLPNGLFNPEGTANTLNDIGDTPNQYSHTGGCPNRVVTDACSSQAPGIMFQNYMDYTNDACLTIFTEKQVARMEWIVANCRPGLLSSPGCQSPADAVLLDVAPFAPVNPGGIEISGCRSIVYPDTLSCAGNLTPKFRVVNNGLTQITSLTVGYSYDNGPAITQTITVSILSGGYAVATFAPIPVTAGTHTLRFFTSNPNGSSDQVTANDSYTKSFTVMNPVFPPLTESFETAFPLQNWAIDNPDSDGTWHRTTPGRGGSAGKLSIDNFTNEARRHQDDLRSTSIAVDPATPYVLTFDVAHKNYPDPSLSDTLAVLISTDCGQTFTRIYYKGGFALSTAGVSDASFTTPGVNDWRTETITLSPSLLASGKIIVLFRNISGYGNWVHLDNINLLEMSPRDLRLVSINSPTASACSGVITPSVSIENVGMETITAFSVGYQIDNGQLVRQTFSQTFAPRTTTTVTLPQSPAIGTGQHTITAFTFNPESHFGSGDTRPGNDTLQKTFTVLRLTSSPIVEGFETAFPPQGWTILNPNNNVTWTKRSPGRNSSYSAFIDNFNHNQLGQTDDLRTPYLDVTGADSVIVSFDVAHKYYSGSYGSSNDRLAVLATTDCGHSYTSVYSKSGTALANGGSTTEEYSDPAPSDWRSERITLAASYITSEGIGLSFRNTNDFGNNIFLDNISIMAAYKRDLQLVSVNQPGNLVCTSSVTPSITVRNTGTEAIQGFKLAYAVNNGAPVIHTVNGLSLSTGDETTVTLPVVSGLTAGGYTLRIYHTELVTASGTNDLNPKNDTLQFQFAIPGSVVAPFTESFTRAGVPPANWSLLNQDSSTTWQHYTKGSGNEGSVYVRTFSLSDLNQKTSLATPIISFGKADSVKLSFDVAAATYSYRGIPGTPMDTLEVLVTKDCGNSFTTVYKRWGTELLTAGSSNSPLPAEFFPQARSDWRKEKVDLSAFIEQSPLVIFFRVTNNNENNIFIDNIHFNAQELPAQLKQEGFQLFPTPFHHSFTVWHYLPPTNLKSIRVMNAAGQMVWSREFSGNADKQIPVDLTGRSAGIYLVELGYNDGKKSRIQKVVKQ